MNKTNTNITFKGKKVTVIGRQLKEGDSVPDFKVTGVDLNDIQRASFAGKRLIVSAVPSIDTQVCSLETKRFNQEAANLGSDVAVLTVSMDLPFAQKRWCAAEGVERVVMGSDYKYRSFGEDFGVFVQELSLLARAVFVAGKDGKIVHLEYIPEITAEPDYNAVIQAVKNL